MATEVKVPTTGNAGEDAVVIEWHCAVGDAVSAGSVLVSLETAKTVIEVESPVRGTLLATNAEEGQEVGEHRVIAIVGEPGEELHADDAYEDDAEPVPPAGSPEPPAVPSGARDLPSSGSRIRVSPRARKLAAGHRLDLSSITGSGPLGRIVIADVLEATDEPSSPESPADGRSTPPVAARAPRIVPVRGARRVTAERMGASSQNAAPVTITRYAPADALESYARRLREAAERRDAPRIGINDLLLFAVARTVGRHPAANAWFSGDAMHRFEAVHLGFAVDTPEALLVPVIRDADLLGLTALSASARSLIDEARGGRLSAAEMDGGTFTVSNLGSLGVHWFTPILNPPQVCILGVGSIQPGNGESGRQLPLSLTFDHRAIDGAAAAALLAALVDAIEHVDTLAAF